MLYLLWSVYVGIICGCQLFEVGVLTSILVTIVLVVLEHINFGRRPFVLILHSDEDIEKELQDSSGNVAKFVYKIITVKGIIDGEEVEYKQGTDYILVGTNKIKWLENAESSPEVGEGYSITYQIMPTYRVVKQIPQVRTSENQRFPKKVVVKLFSAYADKAGVNVQKNNEITKKGINSSF